MTDVTVYTQLIDKYGVNVASTVVVAFLLVLLMRFMMKQYSAVVAREMIIIDQANKERNGWQTIMDGYLSTLKEHSTDARGRYKRVDEAHRYQRDEHIKIIESLNVMCNHIKLTGSGLENAVNTFKMAHSAREKESEAILKTAEALVKNCQECGKLLATINGKT